MNLMYNIKAKLLSYHMQEFITLDTLRWLGFNIWK